MPLKCTKSRPVCSACSENHSDAWLAGPAFRAGAELLPDSCPHPAIIADASSTAILIRKQSPGLNTGGRPAQPGQRAGDLGLIGIDPERLPQSLASARVALEADQRLGGAQPGLDQARVRLKDLIVIR